MKDHQFAFVPTAFSQQVDELTQIHFLEKDWQTLPTLKLFNQLLLKTQINYAEEKDRQVALSNLLANAETNAAQIEQLPALTTSIFYNIALQLLGFLVDQDFTIDHPLAMIKKSQLLFIDSTKAAWDNQTLVKAWYLLLNTRGKNGQPLLDKLAAAGYYRQFNTIKRPLIFNGKAQPVFDTAKLIHEVVYVEAPLDTDNDDHRDLLKVLITRPQDTKRGLKVPTIFTSSPYDQGTNDEDGEKMTHNVNVHLKHKHPGQEKIIDDPQTNIELPQPRKIAGTSKVASETYQDGWTYTLNDYFLARGFAIAYASGIGTKGSDGLRTTGDQFEVTSTTSVIEWLNGKRTAFTNKQDRIATKAWWSNHHIGMTGRSYLGTLQIAAAVSGIDGLKACIPEAGIASWYDYYRENGLVSAPGGFQGEDADVLAEETFSRQQTAGDYYPIKIKWQNQLNHITRGQDRNSGNYNQFWDNANYLKNMAKIKADLLIVQGLNDWNVKPRNANNLWQALKSTPVEQKIVLHQGQHIYINNFQSIDFSEMANLWMTNKLLDVDNHANQVLPNVVIQDNVTPQTWHAYSDWGTTPLTNYYLNAKNEIGEQPSKHGERSYHDNLSVHQLKQYDDKDSDYHDWLHDTFANQGALKDHQLIFKTPELLKDAYIDGEVVVDLNIKTDHDIGLISAFLVDYGDAKRLTVTPQTLGLDAIQSGYHWRFDNLKEFLPQKKTTPFKKISEGHMNMQNRHRSSQVDELKPNQFYRCRFKLQPTFYHLPTGHQLGLVIGGTDLTTTIRDTTPINYTIDLEHSGVNIPFL